MSTVKPLHRYSEEYYALCKRAHTEAVRIPFETKRKALNFRIEMYLFRKALRGALLLDVDSEELQLSVLFAEGLSFSIDGTDLVVDKKRSVVAQKIAEVL